MKAFLMYRDRDFDPSAALPPNADALMQDLELPTLFGAMAQGDKLLFDLAKTAVLSSLTDVDAIKYRQRVLADCLERPAVVREIYELALEGIRTEKKDVWGTFFLRSPSLNLGRGVRVMTLFAELLKKLRKIAEEQGGEFRSEGFVRFFAMLKRELSDDYFQEVREHLARLEFPDGLLISAELGEGNKGVHYVLRRPFEEKKGLIKRLFDRRRSGYSFEIADRDEGGHRALADLRDIGLNEVSNAVVRSVDHIVGFFTMLRDELGFYIGGINLHDQLVRWEEPTCFPVPSDPGSLRRSARNLYDACLSLRLEGRAIGNDLAGDGRKRFVITGANQGGKTTFLRSMGLAQLMMQSGLFVGAESFSADIAEGVFTHFKREEDPTMKSGKLDEELSRMSDIADHIRPHALLLCNESFASTNEREGSEIARQVIGALADAEVRIFFVTFLYDLTQGLYRDRTDYTLFLRAERLADGRRTFRITEGEPLSTGYGEDLFRRIFGTAEQSAVARTGA